jgi:hypothetical protein
MEKTMADQLLRDNKGFVIGKISTGSNGVLTLRDSKGFEKGTYDPRTNITRGANGFEVGKGNLLAALL